MPRWKRSLKAQNQSVQDGKPQAHDELISKNKRRRHKIPMQDTDTEPPSDSDSDVSDGSKRPRKKARRTMSHVRVAGPAFPRSAYQGWQPPLQVSTEAEVLLDLTTEFNRVHATPHQRPEHTFFRLDDFSIYRPAHSRHGHELVTLDRLKNRDGCNEFLFDGILSTGNEQRFVQGAHFGTLTVDGYGDSDITSLGERIWIQSSQAARQNVWYQLGKPSAEYERFHKPFVWLAEFTKYFLDYLLESDRITLGHFRIDFHNWLQARYYSSASFQSWLGQCGLRDFRTTIAAHVGYLWKEAWNIDDDESGLCEHPIWSEVDPMNLKAIPERSNVERKTVVTPFAYDCFKSMYFSRHLEMRHVSNEAVARNVSSRKEALRLTPYGASPDRELVAYTPRSQPDSAIDIELDVNAGDVVCCPPDLNSHWKSASTMWYAYVQTVRREAERTLLDVLWLYEPHDTTTGKAYYPFSNELFLSDNCSCGRDAVDLSSVITKAEVKFFVHDPSTAGLFVRQKFRTVAEDDTYDFVSLQQTDFACGCKDRVSSFENCRRDYQIGDTVLAREYSHFLREDCLEPAQVVDFNLDAERVVLRRLRRKSSKDANARPNELELTEEVFETRPTKVVRKCHVRFFTPEAKASDLPTPYDRNGSGDYYFISGRDESNEPLADVPNESELDPTDSASINASDRDVSMAPIEQGLDFAAPVSFKKLTGMGIFCGGGNFDRGLEDGGAVEFRYAVDWTQRALHSYRANASSNVNFFLGSVNDYIAQAIAGSDDEAIAMPGLVHFLAAGSPCPGFSNLQPDKQSPDSLRNASLVASVISFVDFYSPEYFMLENVVTMTSGMGQRKDENVFAQILAALVALGYQVQQFLMDAWSYGDPQSRSRVFIVASAPGLEPLLPPQHSHAHPSPPKQASLGKSSNGLRFGKRRDDCTPFQHVSAAISVADLPDIADSQPQLCPRFPDHRTPAEQSSDSRNRLALIPVRPYGMGLGDAARNGCLSGKALEYYEGLGHLRKSETSSCFTRVYPEKLFPTVTTALRLNDGVSGKTLHWEQHRSLTVMELRRAQGYPDREVVLGTPAQQVMIIGNSVDRKVALVLGLSLRDSWDKSNVDALGGPIGIAETFSELSIDQENDLDSAQGVGIKQPLYEARKMIDLQADSAHASSAIQSFVQSDHDDDSSDSDVVFIGQRSRTVELFRTATQSPRVVINTSTRQSERTHRRLRLRPIASTQRPGLRTRRSDTHSS